ncbi:MAG: DUF4129 domain-containing protein [Acidobacteria bacterium]|nr:DUF4129 domain-containing protein [Acidobacteriota bacterium]
MRKFLARCLILLLLAAFVAEQGIAATLDEYQSRVGSAIAGCEELIEIIADGDTDLERESIVELRRLVPKSERIDTPGGTVETENSWFHRDLDNFANETDEAKRTEIINSISGRLKAIETGINELTAAASAEQSKDQDKPKLAEILRRQEYQKAEPKGESLFQKWWRQFQEWLAKQMPERAEPSPTGPSFEGLRVVLQVVIFAAVAALIVFLVWRFVPFFAKRRRTSKTKDGDRVILGERIGEDESAADIFSEAERLAGAGDHRGAIRKGYIALLVELGDRKIVRIARHKTNRDYLRDVRKRDELFSDMSGLTSNFERSWYGLRLAGAEDWAEFRERCRRAISSVQGK